MDLRTITEAKRASDLSAIHKQREQARRIREQETAIGAVQRFIRCGK